jgi:hypothetical protein
MKRYKKGELIYVLDYVNDERLWYTRNKNLIIIHPGLLYFLLI